MTATLQENHTVTNRRSSQQSVAPAAQQEAELATHDLEQTQQHFREAFRQHPAGVSVITADSPDGPVGLTATSVSSVSLDPPAVAFSLSALSTTAPAIKAAPTVVVHLLDSAAQHLAQRFATSGIDRFAETSWRRLPTGEPLLQGAATWFRGHIVDTVELGGSTVAVMEILQAGSRNSGQDQDNDDAAHTPLVYCNRSWHGLTEASQIALPNS